MPLDPFLSFAIFMVAGISLCVYVVIDARRDERKQEAARALSALSDRPDSTRQAS